MKSVKKILIFKLCCLGDIVFLTPVISSLKKNYPDAEFTYIHAPWVRNMMKYIKEIDSTIEFDLFAEKNIFKRFIDVCGLIFKLRRKKFDLVFLGHRNSIFGVILFLAGIKQRFGFKGTKFINYSAEFDKSLNETQRYLKVLRENNVTVSDENTHLERPAGNTEIRNSLNIGKSDFVLGIFPFGGVNPGTEMDIKRWGTDNYNELISHIQKNHPEIKIILFEGIKGNENWPHENKYENVLKQKIDLDKISVCDLFISGDTGPLHIAAAFGISTLSIFGPSDPRLVAPVSSNDSKVIHKYIWTKPECSPCYTPETVLDRKNRKYWDGNNFICNTGDHRCVKDISVEYVYSNFVGIINELKNTL